MHTTYKNKQLITEKINVEQDKKAPEHPEYNSPPTHGSQGQRVQGQAQNSPDSNLNKNPWDAPDKQVQSLEHSGARVGVRGSQNLGCFNANVFYVTNSDSFLNTAQAITVHCQIRNVYETQLQP